MTTIGKVNINEVAPNWLAKYLDLVPGQLSFQFRNKGSIYYFIIFCNIQAEALYYTVRKDSGEVLQSQVRLVEYPIDLLFHPELNEISLYYKDNTLYLGEAGEVLQA